MLALLRGRRGLRLGIAAIAALVMLLAPGVAQADVHNVNTTVDDGDGVCAATLNGCTLRDAITDAVDGDTVNVPAGTYVLSEQFGGELLMDADMTIVGAGARQTIISGAGASRVAYIASTGSQVAISGVTLTRGNGVGQINNQGGAVYVSQGTTLGLSNSAVTDSAAPQGGGIWSRGFLALSGVTVSGNRADGLAAPGAGGGIYQVAGTDPLSVMGIVASTISGNSTNGSGGGVFAAGVFQIQRTTIAGNSASSGSGLFKPVGAAATTAAIDDSIVTAVTGTACGGDVAPFTGAFNLADDTSCGFTATGDKENADPLLGVLQDNGGPTNTHALSAGSPAIGAASSAACSGTDQRGVVRPQEGTCDIGAFEYVPPPPPPGGQQPPPPDDQLPPPRAGKTVNALPKSGTVRIKLPGRKRFRRLTEGEQIPVGTTIDTLKGRVTIIAAGGQTADFYGGIFKISQTKSARPLTTLKLVEKLSCAKAGKATIAAKRKKKRRLWGDGKGRFRTDGSYSSATVRGTKWLVEDRCKSTLTRVVRGKVSVRDKVKRKTIIVRRGKRYVAKARS